MKTLTTLFLILLFTATGMSQNECNPYLPAEVGTQWEMTNYNAKGKQQGKIKYELLSKVEAGDQTLFTVQSVTFDKKGKEQFSSTFTAKCAGGRFEFDMAMKMDGAVMGQYEDMDFDVDATSYEIPDMDAAAGTQLADGNLVVTMGDGPIGLNMKIDITDRKVSARENIETPAGSFDCLVLEQSISSKVIINVKGSSKEWYSPNVGVIRTESYNKKGKLMGYSELTSLTK